MYRLCVCVRECENECENDGGPKEKSEKKKKERMGKKRSTSGSRGLTRKQQGRTFFIKSRNPER